MLKLTSCFFLLLFLCHHSLLSVASSGHQFVRDTCKRVAISNPEITAGFCVTSLEADPKSLSSDLPGLGAVAANLAGKNATRTRRRIGQLLRAARDRYDRVRLRMCGEVYGDAIPVLRDSARAFMGKRYEDANVWVSSVSDGAVTCEDSFSEEAGYKSPLTEDNYDLRHLCSIALAITRFLSP